MEGINFLGLVATRPLGKGYESFLYPHTIEWQGAQWTFVSDGHVMLIAPGSRYPKMEQCQKNVHKLLDTEFKEIGTIEENLLREQVKETLDFTQCYACGGKGTVQCEDCTGLGQQSVSCPDCGLMHCFKCDCDNGMVQCFYCDGTKGETKVKVIACLDQYLNKQILNKVFNCIPTCAQEITISIATKSNYKKEFKNSSDPQPRMVRFSTPGWQFTISPMNNIDKSLLQERLKIKHVQVEVIK